MKIVNTDEIEEMRWSSPRGVFAGYGKHVSEALGRDPQSTDLMHRHPFDVEILRVPPGKAPCPHHAHSAQWEFYHIIEGTGIVRHEDAEYPVRAGDAFICKPREAHQIRNCGESDLVVYVIADNPFGESVYYPDSQKVGARLPKRALFRGESLDYYDGEE